MIVSLNQSPVRNNTPSFSALRISGEAQKKLINLSDDAMAELKKLYTAQENHKFDVCIGVSTKTKKLVASRTAFSAEPMANIRFWESPLGFIKRACSVINKYEADYFRRMQILKDLEELEKNNPSRL